MRHRRWRIIRCVPALSEWLLKGPRLSGPPWTFARVRVAGGAAPCGGGGWHTGRGSTPRRGASNAAAAMLVLQQATRLEAELFRHANISGRKLAASRCFRPCLVQRYLLLGHRRAQAEFKHKKARLYGLNGQGSGRRRTPGHLARTDG